MRGTPGDEPQPKIVNRIVPDFGESVGRGDDDGDGGGDGCDGGGDDEFMRHPR